MACDKSLLTKKTQIYDNKKVAVMSGDTNHKNQSYFPVPILVIGLNSFGIRYDFYYLFIYLGFYVAFNSVQVISRRVVGRAEETSTYSSLGFCTVNCRPTASNYQLSHLRPCREQSTTLPPWPRLLLWMHEES